MNNRSQDLSPPKATGDLIVTGIGELATPIGSEARSGEDQGRIERIREAEVHVRQGVVTFAGSRERRRREIGELPAAGHTPRLDVGGRAVVPGFVDAHTHLPWAGSRANELAARLAGRTYLEIASAGGGILSTVAHTRAASEDELTANTEARLGRLLDHGVTTAEAKSGYGLTLEDELKQLRAIQRAARSSGATVIPTLLAAHEFPPEARDDPRARERWVDQICGEIVPAAAEAGLARFCDVFCEEGVFTVSQARRVLVAGREHGLVPRLHADEFVDSGAAILAGELEAASADHLVAIGDDGIRAMATGGVSAVLLPAVSFFLMKTTFAPARRLIDAGIPVCLATDFNPGSSHTCSLPFVAQLGIFRLRLHLEECLTAITLNPAALLGLGEHKGSVEVGKHGDLVVLDGPDLLHLGYRLGSNPVAMVIRGGEVVRDRRAESDAPEPERP